MLADDSFKCNTTFISSYTSINILNILFNIWCFIL